MHTSHDFIATKTCPKLWAFSSFRTGAGLRPKKCDMGWSAGLVRVRNLQVRGGSGQDFSNSCGCGAGADKKFPPAQDSMWPAKVFCAACDQGCSANKKGVGTLPKNYLFENCFQLTLKQNMKKVWERRSHAFPPHYTSARGHLHFLVYSLVFKSARPASEQVPFKV